MSKTLVAHEQSLSKIFSDDYAFYIPGYQRPYAWTTEQARELFEDLVSFMQAHDGSVAGMPPYFLGSIVLIKSESNAHADVVDGQQRLTTLTILLSAVRACSAPKGAAQITSLIYEQGNEFRGTLDRFRLSLRDRDREFFQRYVQLEGGFAELLQLKDILPDSQANIRANAMLFANLLGNLDDNEIKQLAIFIITRCYLVVVATPDLDSAYRIFSVLNSRGLDLSATDILKANIIGGIPDNQKEAYTKKWEDVEEDLGRDSFGDLFGHIRMVYRKSKPKGTLLKEFSDHVQDINHPDRFIDQVLLPMARAYEEILDSSYESTAHAEEVNESLYWLDRLAFNDWVPPMLAYMTRNRQDPDSMCSFVRDLERLAYVMLIVKFGINERIERFSRLTRNIESGSDLWQEDSPLQLTPVEQYMAYEVLNGPLYETLAARARSTVLLRLDKLLSGGGATYDYNTITVEHVLPQNPPSDSQWMLWFPSLKERIQWVHRLGNLALLTRRKNSSASNYDFQRKKQAYFSHNGISPFVMTTQVLDKHEWTPSIVEERHKQLLAVLEHHWRLEERKTWEEDLGL